MAAWGIQHITGVPYNSTGQAITEHKHQDLKCLVVALKKEGELSPHDVITKACYVLNWKNSRMDNIIPMEAHFSRNSQDFSDHVVRVKIWDPRQGQWEGPKQLLTWRRGYACIVSGKGTEWIPAKWVKPWLEIDERVRELVSGRSTLGRVEKPSSDKGAEIDSTGDWTTIQHPLPRITPGWDKLLVECPDCRNNLCLPWVCYECGRCGQVVWEKSCRTQTAVCRRCHRRPVGEPWQTALERWVERPTREVIGLIEDQGVLARLALRGLG